jgi:endonuclease/exonuclease/phosphatase family metal-dependent hydrolase
MTFNVQMLPLVAMLAQGQSDDAEERADRVVAALTAIPPAERPDIIAFNEVFNEDGRDVLERKLRPVWQHMHTKLSDGLLEEDSGLMIVSRLPFGTLPNGGTLLERYFGASEDTDSHASKGFGIVRVHQPVEGTTIVFTHLQASYTTEDQYRDTRQKQIDAIYQGLTDVLGPPDQEWLNVILVGDLNIRGDSGAASDEWSTQFEFGASELFGKRLLDGWRTFMHPPGTNGDPDPGYTNRDVTTGKVQRLDYQCLSRDVDGRPGLKPHYMGSRLRQQSDHQSLEAVIQQDSPNCTPSTAVEVLGINPMSTGSASAASLPRFVPLNIRHPGAYQWGYVKGTGTYTVHASPDHIVELYEETDLSNPVRRVDHLSVIQLPPNVQAAYKEVGGHLDNDGVTVVTRHPFFISVRHRTGQTGPTLIAVLEHRGETPETAIWLSPHVEAESGFPAGQPLGADDTCWFKADPDTIYSGSARNETFQLRNPTGHKARLERHDPPLSTHESVGGSGPAFNLVYSTAGGTTVLLALSRSDQQDTGFGLTWISPVTYVHLFAPLGLHIDNESGIDWTGDDEVRLELTVDDDPLAIFDGSWDDADTGEEWPDLASSIRNAVNARTGQDRNLAYASNMTLGYLERDWAIAQALQLSIIQPLGPSGPENKLLRITLPVPDTISNGQYTFFCQLSRFPS